MTYYQDIFVINFKYRGYNKLKDKNISLFEIAKIFLTIGTVGFGGGMAIIAMIQDYCVNKKNWLTTEEYLHGVALGQFMGPFAVNAAIFVGYRTRGLQGAMTALISFLTPSILIVILLSSLYLKYNRLPSLQSALTGISPAVIAIILCATLWMSKNRFKNIESYILMIGAIILSTVFKFQVFQILLLSMLYAVLKVFLLKKGEVND